MKLNTSGESNARGKISSGDYDMESPWSFSSEDGNKLLGPNGNDWSNYGKWHLGRDTEQKENTKAYYGYPFGKNNKVYHSGLNAIRQRSAGQDATDIFDAAGRLLEQIDQKEEGDEMDDKVLKFKKDSKNFNISSEYRVRAASGNTAEIFLYDVIGESYYGGISASQFSSDLRNLGKIKCIDVRINSDGGDVFDGRTIYTLLKQHPADVTVYVDGLAASIASLIAMAGDEIIMAEGAIMMIHKAWGMTVGNEEDMRKQADVLAMLDQTLLKTYCGRTGIDSKKCLSMMKNETWMDSEECLKYGFCDKTMEPMQIAARVRDLVRIKDGKIIPISDRFKHIPQSLRPKRMAAKLENNRFKEMFSRTSSVGVR